MNLLAATGLGLSIAGALLMTASQSAIWRTAAQLVVAYPRMIGKLRTQRHDRRFGLALVACGALFQALASHGYSAPMSLWRYPACAAAAVALAYGLWRLIVVYSRTVPVAARRFAAGRLYETPRTRSLREAALIEAASLRARELARDPRDNGVVFLTREWDSRWWTNRLGVSVQALRSAIREVGPMVKDVERHLAVDSRGSQALAA